MNILKWLLQPLVDNLIEREKLYSDEINKAIEAKDYNKAKRIVDEWVISSMLGGVSWQV